MNKQVGDEIIILAKAVIKRVSNGHGLCYEVELPRRDYNHDRRFFVEPDEILVISPHRLQLEDGKLSILLDENLSQ